MPDLSLSAVYALFTLQARIVLIESGVGTAKVLFDVLFNMLVALGFDNRGDEKKTA